MTAKAPKAPKAAKPEKPEPPAPKREKYTASLKCKLTAAEVADRADRAAAMLADRDQKEEEQKAAAKHAKSIIEAIDADLRLTSSEVRTRSTYRKVECEREWDFAAVMYREKRLDTDEVIAERRLMESERQLELPLPAAPANTDETWKAVKIAELVEMDIGITAKHVTLLVEKNNIADLGQLYAHRADVTRTGHDWFHGLDGVGATIAEEIDNAMVTFFAGREVRPAAASAAGVEE